MPELLHSLDALRDLAKTAGEPARSWAAALCCVWAPGSGVAPTAPHPIHTDGWSPAMHADPRLPLDPTGPGTASLILDAPRLGVSVSPELIPGLQAAFDRSPGPERIPVALSLATLGALDGPRLAQAAQGAPRASLAAMALQVATARGQGQSAADALSELDDEALSACLDLLGAPRVVPERRSPEDIVADVAATVAVPPPDPPPVRGSRTRQASAWVNLLLSDRDTALAHALRASLKRKRSARVVAEVIEIAAWSSLYAPTDDPVQDVLHRGGASHPGSLGRARALGPQPLADHRARFDGDLLLAQVSQASLGAALERRPDLAPAFIPADPDAVARALSSPDPEGRALLSAAWCPTIQVLERLLEYPVPYTDFGRRSLAWALACMGDPVAAGHLVALAEADPELDVDVPLALTGRPRTLSLSPQASPTVMTGTHRSVSGILKVDDGVARSRRVLPYRGPGSRDAG